MWPDHCVQNTDGAELHPDLIVNAKDISILKGRNAQVDSYSGFGDGMGHTLERTELHDKLLEHGITDVFVCGKYI